MDAKMEMSGMGATQHGCQYGGECSRSDSKRRPRWGDALESERDREQAIKSKRGRA